MVFLLIVLKMRQPLTFSATIKNEHQRMQTLAVISLLALIAIGGAAYSDQVLTSQQQQVMPRTD
ncbi:MAG: hypothetical protein KGQ48_11245 [Bradyrhizobium sp.]|nr:hypothetical protein [Bradyrhizobium sp.]